MKCAVNKCNNENSLKACKISFFNFPLRPDLLKQWILFCDRKGKFNVKTSHVCMEHFKQEDFENNLQYEMGFTKRRFLKRGAVPTIRKVSYENEKLYKERATRIQKRENKKIVEMILKEQDAKPVFKDIKSPRVQVMETEVVIEQQPEYEDIVECQKENLYKNNNSDIKCLKKEREHLLQENSALKLSFKKQAAQLRALEEKKEKDSKIYEFEIDNLKNNLTKAHFELNNLEKQLLVIFTKGQIAKLKAGVKRTKWSEEDITQAITLYATSAKLYKLMYRKQFPLPAVRTLQAWCQKVHINPGLLEPVFKLLSAATHMTENDKICVLSFDEAKIRKVYSYDRSSDTILAPTNYVQVAMIRGLSAKWKQPIFYNYDCKMTVDILDNILSKLKSCDFTVVAVVSDLGGGNRALFNELQVTEEKPWFMFNGEKVFVFADVPHMIKLLRNHFIDEGFLINGKAVRADIISKLLDVTSGDLTITHKISQASINVANTKRQKVKLATKLFSHTVAQAITRAASQGHLEGFNWEECHHLFKLTNDWFDVMNVKIPYPDARERCHAYGLALETQNNIIDEMTKMVKEMRPIGRKALLPFQRGIIQTNNAIKELYEEMKSRYNWQFILTYRLNQDVLENFFGVIRSKGGLHDHPDQLEFKYRLKSYILGHNDGIISNDGNIECDDTPDLEKSLTGKIIGVLNVDVNAEETDEKELTDLQYDGLENLAGYICHKLKNYIPDIAVAKNEVAPTYSWVDHLSEGGLSKPTPQTMKYMEELYQIFEKNNDDGLLIKNNFIKDLVKQAEHIKCDEKVKKLFFRARMYFKIRKLNLELKDNSTSRKRKFNKIKN